ncbi:MAG: hypothetical protein LWW74_06785 [Burkholderiales bacterium]|nr:hypothetical protein [Burkholderiales bacterium]
MTEIKIINHTEMSVADAVKVTHIALKNAKTERIMCDVIYPNLVGKTYEVAGIIRAN